MTRSQAHADKKAVIAARVEQEWALRAVEEHNRRIEHANCCAKCRRGTRALLGPCGYEGRCKCHTGRTS